VLSTKERENRSLGKEFTMKVTGTSSDNIALMNEAIRRLHEQHEPRIKFLARAMMLQDPNWGLDLAMRKVKERRGVLLKDLSAIEAFPIENLLKEANHEWGRAITFWRKAKRALEAEIREAVESDDIEGVVRAMAARASLKGCISRVRTAREVIVEVIYE
jgi:hypothetical protein